jgi:hypothetical protein
LRVIEPELLDHAPPAEAARNLAELRFINRYLGGHGIAIGRLRQLYSAGDRFTFADIGAASGDIVAAARERFPHMRAVNFDLQFRHLESGGVCADAFRLPVADRAFDVAHCSLFLHHFDDDEVVALLAEMRRIAKRAVIVQDLERNAISERFIPWTRWLFGWSDIVVHDAPVSVRAAFRADELAALARRAGLGAVKVRRHYPAFRLSFAAIIEK